MWRKSAVRRLFKLMPKSAELLRLDDADNAGDAGQVQILHAPDPENARLLAEAEAASTAAEASQEPVSPKLARKRAAARRSRGKKQRGGVKASAA